MNKNILFVDDELSVLDGFRRMLHDREAEWEMRFVSSSTEAHDIVSKLNFDVIVLDVKLPGKGGLELLEEWKRGDSRHDFEVIMLTGLEDEGLKRKVLDLGATDLLNKPVSKDDLIARLENVLRMKSYRESLLQRTVELEKEVERREKAENDLKRAYHKLEDVNAMLKKLAVQDQLTGLFNRRVFDEKLNEYSNLSERSGQPLSCLICDLDHFKLINDTYGHQAGDYILSNIAGILAKGIRKSDIITRYGGEEFAALFPNTPLKNVLVLAEKLRKSVNDATLSFEGNDLHITISIGVSIGYNKSNLNDQLLKAADLALYRAKSLGRNRVCSM